MDGHSALLASTIKQAAHTVDQYRQKEPTFEIGDLVYLSTAHRRSQYLHGDAQKVVNFMLLFYGPYNIVSANIDFYTYTFDLQDHTHLPKVPRFRPHKRRHT